MKRIITTVLVLVMLMTMVIGCSGAKTDSNAKSDANTNSGANADAGKDNKTAESSGGAKKLQIGVSMKGLQDQFVKNIADAIKARADEVGNIDLIMMDAQGEVNTQLSQVENLVTQKVDALILNAMDAEGSGPAVDLAKSKGIPVVESNTLTKNDKYDVYVGSSDVDAGKIQGEFLKQLLGGKGEIAILHGPMGQSPEIFRKQGLKESLLDTCPEIKVVAEQTANWKREEAMRITEDWLQKFPQIKAIAAQNDDMAMGALQAVEAKGRKDVVVVGVDAIPDALQAVKDGRLACTVFQDSKGQGAGSLDAAIKLANGEKVDKQVLIPFQLVTKENVDKFMGLNAK